MDKSIFNRTVKTNIVLYPTDGMGRDGYITYNDAGFWKENIKPVCPKITYGRKPFPCFKSLKRIPPSWNYHSDGTGRDTYILYNYGGLIKKYVGTRNILKNLRSNDEYEQQRNPIPKFALSNAEKIYYQQLKKVQKNLVDRLYNKCIDKFRYKNLSKSNSCTNLQDQDEGLFYPKRNENLLHRSCSNFSSSKLLNNNNFGDYDNSRNLNEVQPKRVIKYGMNYRTNDDGYFNFDYKSNSLPKYAANRRYNFNSNEESAKNKIKVVSNSLNKNFGFPEIGNPKNLEEEKI